MKIEIISGSPREGSLTYRVALHLKQILEDRTDHQIGIVDVRENGLPPLTNVFVSESVAPQEFKELAKRMFEAEAFILVSPEFNGSYSPDLKNLLDHFPKQYRKPFGIVTASPGALGGIRAALQLQALVYALFGIGSPHMLLVPTVDKKFDKEGNLLDTNFAKSIDTFVTEFIWLAEKLAEEKVVA